MKKKLIVSTLFLAGCITFTAGMITLCTHKEVKVAKLAVVIKEPETMQVVKELTSQAVEDESDEIQTENADKPIVMTEKVIPCIWGGFAITESEFELICRTVYCEAGNQSIGTQIMVALTILNRLNDNKDIFPNNVHEVIFGENAYEVTEWEDFWEYKWTESVEQAVATALEVNIYPDNMFYFRTEHYHYFGEPYMKSDDLYFSVQGGE